LKANYGFCLPHLPARPVGGIALIGKYGSPGIAANAAFRDESMGGQYGQRLASLSERREIIAFCLR